MNGPGVVLGLVGNDIHVVANRLLEIGIAENGLRTYNIGTNNTADDFACAVLETGAAAVLVASVNGEGERSCAGFGAAFAARGLSGVLRYVGGNLAIGIETPADLEQTFIGYGFHRVFHQPAGFQTVYDALRGDLSRGRPD